MNAPDFLASHGFQRDNRFAIVREFTHYAELEFGNVGGTVYTQSYATAEHAQRAADRFLAGDFDEVRYQHKGRFVVWRKGTKWPPRVFHPTLESAEAEARRLARKHTGARFHVIHWLGKHFSPFAAPSTDTIEQTTIAEVVA